MDTKWFFVAGYIAGFFVTALMVNVIKRISLLGINRGVSLVLALVIGAIILVVPIALAVWKWR